VALAVAFVLLPVIWLRKGADASPVQSDAISIALLKEQLEEAQLQHQAGVLSDEDYRETRQELELRIVTDAAQPTQHQRQEKYGVLLLLALSLPPATWWLYHEWGNGQAWSLSERYQLLNQQFAKGEGDSASAALFVDDLARFNQRKGTPDWLFLQAQLSMQLGQYQAAADTYASLAAKEPGNAEIIARQAQAQYLAAGRKIDAQVDGLMQQVLAIDPHQPTVLGLRGMDAFERADYAQAISAWEKALGAMPPGSPSAKVLEQGIGQARLAMGEAGESVVVEAQPVVAGFTDGIKVRVELDQAARVAPGSTVYVIASGPNGGMPFAVVRMPVEGLPTEVVLDDSTAMAPGNSLSRQQQVKVIARVSRSGNAIAQAGDWQGRSELLTPQTVPEVVAIRIDQEI
jgi:cytochrome c-type biogenesis protein CcmH